jgi:hypothetical protein
MRTVSETLALFPHTRPAADSQPHRPPRAMNDTAGTP